MAAVAVAAMAKLCSSCPYHHLSKPAKKKLYNSPKFIFSPLSSTSKPTLTLSSRPPIYASNSPVEDEASSTDGIIPQEDLKYLWKLGAGSVAAAAFIKYGSVLFPQITTPNLFVALAIVSTPVLVAVYILINKSCST